MLHVLKTSGYRLPENFLCKKPLRSPREVFKKNNQKKSMTNPLSASYDITPKDAIGLQKKLRG